MYCSSYYPNLNPIEKVFAVMKRRLQRHQGWATAVDKGGYLLRIAGQLMICALTRPLFESSGIATQYQWAHIDAQGWICLNPSDLSMTSLFKAVYP